MTRHIQILSPHLDDAVLSCSAHIGEWLEQGSRITVCTLFSSFASSPLSQDARDCISELGFTTAGQYERKRLNEDKAALKSLGVTRLRYAGFTDGGFRSYNKRPVYAAFSELFTGNPAPSDTLLLSELTEFLKTLSPADWVVVPLSVGRHVDHLLTRLAAEKTFPENKIIYYADAPYMMLMRNWSLPQVLTGLKRKISIRSMSEKKRTAVNQYDSQVPRLFTTFPIRYPELLFFPRSA